MADNSTDPADPGPHADRARRWARFRRRSRWKTYRRWQHSPVPGAPFRPETRRLYEADWAGFASACRRQGVEALPAAAGSVASHLAGLSATRGPGALARSAAAINTRHRSAGLPAPGGDPDVKALLSRSRAASRPAPAPGARRPRAIPPGPAQQTRMAASCRGDLAGLRDRALLLLAAAGLDPVLLLGLHREYLSVSDTGAELALEIPEDTDGEQRVGRISVRRAASAANCPVRALHAWLLASDTRFGPVFRKVDRWGNVEHAALGVASLRLIWRRRAQGGTGRRHRAATGGKPAAPDPPSHGA